MITHAGKSQTSRSQPNIVLIMCDDLGWGDVGFNGNKLVKTPNLDSLAHHGVILRRFYSAGAVCSPTRASCLTGRNPNRLGIMGANSGHMKEEEITLPELLKNAGYQTGHFGKWHLGTLTTKIKDANRGLPRNHTHYSIPTQHGYDTYLVTESKVPTFDPMIRPDRFDTTQGESLRYGWSALEDADDGRQALSYGTYYWKGRASIELTNVEGSNARIIMDRVVPFVRQATNEDQPFFAAIWFHTPHLPLVTNEIQRSKYAQLSHREQLLYGSISAMDEQVGRLMRVLHELNEADNTMIWFCSDNGPERDTPSTAGPFRGQKRDLYEGGVRVPAFCHWPNGLTGGKVIDAPMVTSDYLPTIVNLLDLSYPIDRPIDGLDVWPLVTNDEFERNAGIGFSFKDSRSWVTNQYKLITLDRATSFELYDLLKDPEESQDISSHNVALVKELQSDLEKWLQSVEQSQQGADY